MPESLFIVLVVMLLLLAALDLFVGVSNDAANFLNSAVGTRIAPMTVIMLVASAGVLLGATFSSGMMDIARHGMLHPEMFNYEEIMLIFASVMISDVLLLNIFNTFGLPTSTTVSIIFELLGASVFASFFKLYITGNSFTEIMQYIKLDRTAAIVSGILLSVVIAFMAGMIVQFVCRVLFTFRFRETYKYLGGIFTALSLTAISYFLIIKGAKGASFMKPEYLAFIDAYTSEILWFLMGIYFVLGQVLALMGKNIFRLIVLSGTFALAFSFAGNDLVNFVGVPLAALDSYETWSPSGIQALEFLMGSLNDSARTATFWLFLSGAIMCLTLWVSKKARKVVQTTVNLSSSAGGQHEQFGASSLGRIITRMGLGVSRFVYMSVPKSMLAGVAKRYRKAPIVKGQLPMPFDYVRASINLVVASALISFATSLKLPLSTTYVTFMVAMGTSFADGAWDRESAVYRISGVVTVVAGWFLTGISAFTFSCFIALVLFNLKAFAVVTLIPVVFGLIIYSNFIKKPKAKIGDTILKAKNDGEILSAVSAAVPEVYAQNIACLGRALDSFFDDNEFALRRARNKASNVQESISEQRGTYYSLAQELNFSPLGERSKSDGTPDAKFFFYLVYSNMLEACKSIRYAIDQAVTHVANRHTIFGGQMKLSLFDLFRRLQKVDKDLNAIGLGPSAVNVESLVKHTRKLNRDIDRFQLELISIIGSERVSMHSAEMYLTFIQAMRDLASRYATVGMQEHALAELVAGNCVMTPVDEKALAAAEQLGGGAGTGTDTDSDSSSASSNGSNRTQGRSPRPESLDFYHSSYYNFEDMLEAQDEEVPEDHGPVQLPRSPAAMESAKSAKSANSAASTKEQELHNALASAPVTGTAAPQMQPPEAGAKPEGTARATETRARKSGGSDSDKPQD